MMEHNITYYHKQLQENILLVEKDETNQDALNQVRDLFLVIFDMIKMIMISRQERYYGLFLMNFDLRVDFTLHCSACVSIDFFPFRMSVNPLLLGKGTLSEMIYIMCHEIEHIVLNHPADGMKYNPQKDPREAYKLNVAMDASINDRLSMDSKAQNFNVISEPVDAITSQFLSEALRIHIKPLQAFDYYYDRIVAVDSNSFGGSLPKKIIVMGQKDGKNEIITDPKRKGMICIHGWTASDDPDEAASVIRKFISDVCEGMTDEMRGKLSAQQRETLEKLLSPPVVSWKQLLKRYVGTIPYGHRKTRTRLSRRQPERFDISGSINNRIIKMVVAIDTSGSMTKETLERIMVEIFGIIGSRLCDVTIIECDAKIQRVYKVASPKDVSYDIQGCGGTSYVPVIEYLNRNRQYRDAILIYFTDGKGDRSIPKPLVQRTMWVLEDESCILSARQSYGEILVMD